MQSLTPRWNPITEKGIERLTGRRRDLWLDSIPQSDGMPRVRHAVIDAGRQSLKTELMCKRLPVLYLPIKKPWPDPRYLYGAPTDDQAVAIVWSDLKKLVPKEWIRRISESTHTIYTKFGSELWVRGVDKPSRAEGMSWDGVILDESSNLRPGVWGEHLQPLLAARRGWSRHVGVPDYDGEGAEDYKRRSDRAASGHSPNWQRYTWHSTEVLTDEAIAEAREDLTALQFKQEYEAEWVTAPGRAYYEYSESVHVAPVDVDPRLPIRISCDFNRQYHNWVVAQVDEAAHKPFFRFVDQIYAENATVGRMIAQAQQWITLHYGERALHAKDLLFFYGDYSGEQQKADAPHSIWEQIREAFPHATFCYRPQGPITTRLERFNAALRNADGLVRITIDPKCVELMADLEFVHTSMLLGQSKKTGKRTHASDAGGYLISQYESTRKETARRKALDMDKLNRQLGRR